ncbi:hypothetical protein [Frankia sp. Cppng1_Ct_nod]|uniref:hypothetical protein n=1 Tax=Frankia sp. Cppng1_Ct_nod TaxID=2897162 RepID=UPI001040F7BC|nr:hypothetical protein [Frankia sp. Cppng1_Ct_nod]
MPLDGAGRYQARIERYTTLDADKASELARDMVDLDSRRFRPGSQRDIVLGLVSVALLVGVALLSADPALPFAARPRMLAVVQAGIVVAYLLLSMTGRWPARGMYESRVAIQIFEILEKLKMPDPRPANDAERGRLPVERFRNDTDFRWEIAVDLERAAVVVERIPLASRRLAPVIRAEVFRLSRAKADGLRELQRWTVRPLDSTFTDLAAQLNLALELLVDGRWYELPEAEIALVTARSRLRWLAIIAMAMVAVAGVVVLTAFSTTIGPAAPVLSTLAGVIGVGVLHKAGLSPAMLGQYVGVSTSFPGESPRPERP